MAKSYQGSKSRRNPKRAKQSKGNVPMRRDARPQDDEKRTGTEGDYRCAPKSSLNDISWYSRNPALLVAAGSFPYPYRPGMPMKFADTSPTATTTTYLEHAMPGVMALDWVPTFGNSGSSLDPASIAGKEFYARVRAAFSGSLDADAPDFIPYIGALDSIFTYIGWMKRVFRTLSTYTPDNLLLSETLMAGYGFSQAQLVNLRTNKTRFWQGINEVILMSRKFKCPAVMDLFNRHYWMSDNVYADAPTLRAQLYIFNLRGVYKIGDVKEASSGDTISGLVLTPISVHSMGGTDVDIALVDFCKSLIQALDAWDDGYLISGYLQRAFDGTPNFEVAELQLNELITAQYVPEVLSQIENSRPILVAQTAQRYSVDQVFSGMTVSQNASTNAVVSNVDFKLKTLQDNPKAITRILEKYPSGVSPLLNIRNDSPSVADSVIASRLQVCCEYSISNTNVVEYSNIACGTELPICWYQVITYYNPGIAPNGVTYVTQLPHIMAYDIPETDAGGETGPQLTTTNVDRLFAMEQFDWHPFYFVVATNETARWSVIPVGDTFNQALISKTDLANLHKICFYSEMNSFAI